MRKFTIEMIDDYQDRLTDEQKKLLIRHCNKYNVFPNICAWYDDLNDFYYDWCDNLNYSKSDARDLLKNRAGNLGEFKIFFSGEIVRLAL